jgi:RNA polymerase sigma-70 factor (ECF subfamily)
VSALGLGDQSAMTEIVRRHRDGVVALARRLVGDQARAEEVAQEVFLRLWQRSGRFDPERGHLRTFLLAMTHGHAVDVVRSDVSRRRREDRDHERPGVVSTQPEDQAVTRTISEVVRSALAMIPEGERRAVELAYLGGHSYRAVALMLDEPEGTVKSRIRSGLVRLRTALAAQDLLSS